MSCLIPFVYVLNRAARSKWKVKKYKIKIIAHIGLELATLRFLGRPSILTELAGIYENSLFKVTFINVLPLHWYKLKAWWTRVHFVLYMCSFVLHIGIYLYWIDSKKTQKSCVCFHHANIQTCYLIWYASRSNFYPIGHLYKGHFKRKVFITSRLAVVRSDYEPQGFGWESHCRQDFFVFYYFTFHSLLAALHDEPIIYTYKWNQARHSSKVISA